MGSYAYCRHPGCDAGVSAPTLFEVVYDTWECHQGHHQELDDRHKGQALLDLDERLSALEERVAILELA